MIGNNAKTITYSSPDRHSGHVHSIIDGQWREKAAKLQSRRWKKIHELEARDDGGFLKPWAEV